MDRFFVCQYDTKPRKFSMRFVDITENRTQLNEFYDLFFFEDSEVVLKLTKEKKHNNIESVDIIFPIENTISCILEIEFPISYRL